MVQRVIDLLVVVALIEMMFAIGLGVTLRDLLNFARNWKLLAGAGLANYVGVPALTLILLMTFNTEPIVAAGFLILAVCPGAPFGPPCTALARGNVTASVGLMVLLAASSAVLAPLLLQGLLLVISGARSMESTTETPQVEAMQVVRTLLVTQLIPLAAGLAVRRQWPALASRLYGPANTLSAILGLVLLVLILAVQLETLREIRLAGFAGMLILLAGSWACGWLMGGSSAENRRALTLTTSLRNVGVGLVIANSAFAGSAAVTAVIAYGIIEILGTLLLAIVWGRAPASAKSHGDHQQPSDTWRTTDRQLS
jgi:BASS family bile acid:Na+ symporter